MEGIVVGVLIALYVLIATQAEKMNMNFFTFTIGYGGIAVGLWAFGSLILSWF